MFEEIENGHPKHTSPEEPSLKRNKLDDSDLNGNVNGSNSNSFLSEIVRNEDDVYDVNYNREKRFTSDDQAKDTIDNMTKPRLPPLTNLSMNETINIPLAAAAKKNILNKIEKSRSCNESVNSNWKIYNFRQISNVYLYWVHFRKIFSACKSTINVVFTK